MQLFGRIGEHPLEQRAATGGRQAGLAQQLRETRAVPYQALTCRFLPGAVAQRGIDL